MRRGRLIPERSCEPHEDPAEVSAMFGVCSVLFVLSLFAIVSSFSEHSATTNVTFRSSLKVEIWLVFYVVVVAL